MNKRKLNLAESNASIIAALIGMFVGAIVLVVIIALYAIGHEGTDFKVLPAYMYLAFVITEGFMIAGVLLYTGFFKRVNLFRLFSFKKGFEIKRVVYLPFIAVGAVLLFAPIAELFVSFLMLFGYQPAAADMSADGVAGFFILLATGALLPAVIEEIVFRGALMSGAKKRGAFFAVVYTSFIFMLFHGNPQQTVHQFLLGLVLGWMAVTTGNISYGIILHFLNNLIAFSLVYAPIGEMHPIARIAMYAAWMLVGALILIPSLKAFGKKSGESADGAITNKGNFISRYAADVKGAVKRAYAFVSQKGTFKTMSAAFDLRYAEEQEPLITAPGEAIPEAPPKEKIFSAAAVILILGCAAMWLLSLFSGG
ncbi:MAG: CPBP family intramembrane metalloprotease [Clostridiales bacterium]|jgi:membrane protease YdiL (CAAX protease family)|nr:CPBP family intramembrane metalloprotease [Clostridiales bacterium]